MSLLSEDLFIIWEELSTFLPIFVLSILWYFPSPHGLSKQVIQCSEELQILLLNNNTLTDIIQ